MTTPTKNLTTVAVDKTVHQLFRDYCKRHKVPLQTATEKLFQFMMANHLKLKDLGKLEDGLYRMHNYTVSFLKEYERKQNNYLIQLTNIIHGINLPVEGEKRQLAIALLQDTHENLLVVIRKLYESDRNVADQIADMSYDTIRKAARGGK